MSGLLIALPLIDFGGNHVVLTNGLVGRVMQGKSAEDFIESSLKALDLWNDKGSNDFRLDVNTSNAEKLVICEADSQCPGIKELVLERVFVGRRSYKLQSGMISPGVLIGRFCSISHYVNIGSTNHPMEWLSTGALPSSRFYDNEPRARQDALTIIQNDVWIGVNATILGGKDIVIGHGACIGAGAVVTKSVPPYAIVVGNPARIIRYRFPEETVERLLQSKWWRLSDEVISRLPYREIEIALDILEEMSLEGAD